MQNYKMKAESFRVKLIPRKQNWIHPDGESGIYRCELAETPEKEVRTNYQGSFNIKGSIPYELKIDKPYVVYLFGNPEYNEKFRNYTYKIDKFEVEQLTLPEEQFEFLATVATESIYEQLEKLYRDQPIIDLIFEDKIDLTQINGLKEKTFEKLKEKLEMYRDLGKLQNLLRPLGVTIRSIKKIANHFGNPDSAYYKIKESMYNLCEVKGFGFAKVDEIALKAGTDPRDELRVKYCLGYILEQGAQSGHSWGYREELKVEAIDLLKIEPLYVDQFYDKNIYQKGEYYHTSDIIVVGDLVSTFGMYYDERNTLDNLDRILENYVPLSDDLQYYNQQIDDVQESLGIIYTQEQRDAIINGLKHGVYIIEGLAGTGKCVEGKTLIPTEKGLIKIEDIPTYFKVDFDDTCEAGIISFDLEGNRIDKNTSHFFNMGHSKTIKMKTSQGYYVEGTPEHPIITLNKEGRLEFKKLGEMDGSEVVPISKNNSVFSKENKVNENIAYWLGLLVGDGSTNGTSYETKHYQFLLTNGVKEIGDSFIEITKEEFNLETKVRPDRNTMRYTIGNKEFNSYAKEELDLPMCTAPYKYIPSTVMQSTKPVVRKFLQGLFDTDGSFTKRNEFEFSTASSRLANEVHVLLLNFGIIANLREKTVKDKVYYIITIRNPLFVKKFYEEIGFLHEFEKQSKLEHFVNTHDFTVYNDNLNILTNMNDLLTDVHEYFLANLETYTKKNKYKIPCGDKELSLHSPVHDKRINKRGHRRSISSQSMELILEYYPEIPHAEYFRNIIENFFIDYIDEISESEAIVYDFTVPNTHSFVSNGIVSHNTTIIKAIEQIQAKRGVPTIAVALSGKAANILSSKGLNAATIHRTLGFNGDGFAYNRSNPAPFGWLNLDEAGMANASLWNALTSAIPDRAQFIVSGDSGQLAAIGAGDVMRDILGSIRYPKVELKQIHRQAKDSGVIEVAHKVRYGENITSFNREMNEVYGKNQDLQIITQSKPRKDDVVIHQFMTDEEEKEAYNPIYVTAKRIIEAQVAKIKYSDNPAQELLNFQIICPTKAGSLGVDSINRYFQHLYNDNKEGISKGNTTFKKDDKVINNGNSYNIIGYESISDFLHGKPIMAEPEEIDPEIQVEMEEEGIYISQEDLEPVPVAFDLFNGTLGIVQGAYPDKQQILVKFEGIDALIAIHEDSLDSLDLGYAITVHKSQGSSIPNVLVLFDFSAFKLLSKQLIYTAITRTSTGKCIVLCENNALNKAIQVDASGFRRTFMRLFLDHLDQEQLAQQEEQEHQEEDHNTFGEEK